MIVLPLALLLLVIILDLRRKKYQIIIFSKETDKIIKEYRSNIIPDQENVLMFDYGREAYLVRRRLIRTKDDTIILHVTDISNDSSITYDPTGTIPE